MFGLLTLFQPAGGGGVESTRSRFSLAIATAIATKFGTEVVFWQVHTCAMFHCPSSTVTLFSGGGVESPPGYGKPKKARLK